MTFVIIIMNGLQLWSAQLLCIVAVLGADFGCEYAWTRSGNKLAI